MNTTKTIKVLYLLSEESQRALLLSGEDPQQQQQVIIELGDPAWGLAASLAKIAPDGSATVWVGHSGWGEAGAEGVAVAQGNILAVRTITFDTPESMMDLLQGEKDRRNAVVALEGKLSAIRESAERERIARAEEARRAAADSRLQSINAGLEELRRLGRGTEVLEKALIADGPTPDLESRVDRAVVHMRALVAHEARNEWVAKHGSDRLKMCLEEGIEARALYLDERLAKERPNWSWLSKNSKIILDEPRNPNQKALDILVEARRDSPSARLKYMTIERQRGRVVETRHGDRPSKFAWVGLIVTDVMPDGGEQIAYNKVVSVDGVETTVAKLIASHL